MTITFNRTIQKTGFTYIGYFWISSEITANTAKKHNSKAIFGVGRGGP
jgi:hypothetical protein